MREWILVSLFMISHAAFAASPYKRSLNEKKNVYIRDGVFIGGKATGGSSILGLRRAYAPKINMERIIVDLGDREAKPAHGDMGFYQVSLDSKNQRLILDLSQLMISKVNERQVQEMFKKSPFVSSAEFTLDPEDQAATLVLNLKQPMRLETFRLRHGKRPARLVMDLKPLNAGKPLKTKKARG